MSWVHCTHMRTHIIWKFVLICAPFLSYFFFCRQLRRRATMRKSGPDTKVQTSSERNNGNGQLRNKNGKNTKKNAAKAGVSRRARHTLAQSQQQNQADQLIVRVYERMSVCGCVCVQATCAWFWNRPTTAGEQNVLSMPVFNFNLSQRTKETYYFIHHHHHNRIASHRIASYRRITVKQFGSH